MRHVHWNLLTQMAVLALAASACADAVRPNELSPTSELSPICSSPFSLSGTDVPACLLAQNRIDSTTFRTADSVLRAALVLADSMQGREGTERYIRHIDLLRAVGQVADYYAARLFPDSVRFDRMIDQVAVTAELARGPLVTGVDGAQLPLRTPSLGWYYYPYLGIHFQPVTSVQRLITLIGAPDIPTDTLNAVANAIWNYAIWHNGGGRAFPRWEYQFTINLDVAWIKAPWQSAMAQGSVLGLFAELYRRTGDGVWKDRAEMVLRSFEVSMDDGGALMPDTTHGFWWEEVHPRLMVWNGSVKALLTLGDYAYTFNDAEALRMYARGIEAVKYYTPLFDTGTWTLYARTGVLNDQIYHDYHIELLDALYAQNHDPWFKQTAERWRQYVRPPAATRPEWLSPAGPPLSDARAVAAFP